MDLWNTRFVVKVGDWMAKIIAKGMFSGVEHNVECISTDEGLQIDFDGAEAEFLEQEFRKELNQRHAVGGTYYPPQESMINALNALQYYFFDGEPEITVDGNIGEIPHEKDIVY